jgi:hypothetical protein
MEKTFEDKLGIVASAYFSRYDEEAETEVLQKIFENHDMSGAIALAVVGGDVEIKTDQAKEWIESTYNVLTAVFDFPDDEESVVQEEAKPAKKAPAKKKATPKP